MANATQGPVSKGAGVQFTSTITGKNGYYPAQNDGGSSIVPFVYDTAESRVTTQPVASVTASDPKYTYPLAETSISESLVASQFNNGNSSLVYRTYTLTGTTPSAEPTSTENTINYNANSVLSATRVVYCSKNTVSGDTITFKPVSYENPAETDRFGKEAYMGVGMEMFKDYTTVWGPSSVPTGYTFLGWDIYQGTTELYTDVTAAGSNTTVIDDYVFDDVATEVTIYFYPKFRNDNMYNVTVDYDDAKATVTLL